MFYRPFDRSIGLWIINEFWGTESFFTSNLKQWKHQLQIALMLCKIKSCIFLPTSLILFPLDTFSRCEWGHYNLIEEQKKCLFVQRDYCVTYWSEVAWNNLTKSFQEEVTS